MKLPLLLSLLLAGCADEVVRAQSSCPQPVGLFRMNGIERGGSCGQMARNLRLTSTGIADSFRTCVGGLWRTGPCQWNLDSRCYLYSSGNGGGDYYGFDTLFGSVRQTSANYLKGEVRRRVTAHDDKPQCLSVYDVDIWKIE